MKSFHIWLESRASQVDDALEHLEVFPELERMSYPEMVKFLSSAEIGYDQRKAALLAARINMVRSGSIDTQDFRAGDQRSASVMNRLMDRRLGRNNDI